MSFFQADLKQLVLISKFLLFIKVYNNNTFYESWFFISLQAQIILLGALLIAILNFVVGTFIPPSDEKIVQGIVGYQGE